MGFTTWWSIALSMANMPLVNVWPKCLWYGNDGNFFTIDCCVTDITRPLLRHLPTWRAFYSVSPDPNADLSGDPGQYLSGKPRLLQTITSSFIPNRAIPWKPVRSP